MLTVELAFGVDVGDAQGEGAPAAAGGLGLQAQQQGVQGGVVTASGGGGVDRGEFAAGQGAADIGQSAGFGDLVGGLASRVR